MLATCGLLLWAGVHGDRAWAQERPHWRIVVQLGEGIYVRTGIGTIPPQQLDLDEAVRGAGYLGLSRPGGGSLRRILKLADGRAIVYEVVVKRTNQRQRFEVVLQPVTPTPAESAQWGIDPARIEAGFLQHYASPLTLDEGDILALDVLIEPRTGVKFVDYFLISNGTSPIKRQAPAALLARARPFSPEDAELSIEGYELWRNGQLAHQDNEGAATGRFIWLDLPNLGRVIFTLAAPPEEAGFERAAVVSDHQIVFTLGASQYEWLSRSRIAPGSGVYHLWMRHDLTQEKEAGWRIGSASDVGQKLKKE
jgi:hypothetical protein